MARPRSPPLLSAQAGETVCEAHVPRIADGFERPPSAHGTRASSLSTEQEESEDRAQSTMHKLNDARCVRGSWHTSHRSKVATQPQPIPQRSGSARFSLLPSCLPRSRLLQYVQPNAPVHAQPGVVRLFASLKPTAAHMLKSYARRSVPANLAQHHGASGKSFDSCMLSGATSTSMMCICAAYSCTSGDACQEGSHAQ